VGTIQLEWASLWFKMNKILNGNIVEQRSTGQPKAAVCTYVVTIAADGKEQLCLLTILHRY
jgi:hypothetical protein